jgi:hypothetical protein
MTEHDRDEMFNWVSHAYATTPPPTDAARARTVAAVHATMAKRSVTPIRRWMLVPAVTLLAAACALVVWWQVIQQDRRKLDVTVARALMRGAESSAIRAHRAISKTPGNTSATGKSTNAPSTQLPPTTSPDQDYTSGDVASVPSTSLTVTPRPVDGTPQTSSIHPPVPLEGLDAESTALINGILDSASARGLPTDALIARVREGIRRHVPAARIVVVTRNYATALADARSVLGSAATPSELQSGAEALIAGTPISALQRLRTKGQVTPPGVDHPFAPSGPATTLPKLRVGPLRFLP